MKQYFSSKPSFSTLPIFLLLVSFSAIFFFLGFHYHTSLIDTKTSATLTTKINNTIYFLDVDSNSGFLKITDGIPDFNVFLFTSSFKLKLMFESKTTKESCFLRADFRPNGFVICDKIAPSFADFVSFVPDIYPFSSIWLSSHKNPNVPSELVLIQHQNNSITSTLQNIVVVFTAQWPSQKLLFSIDFLVDSV